MEEREITFGFQASIAWSKCIDFQTVMLEGERWHISFDIHSSLPTSFFWSVLASDQRGPWKASMLWAAWGLGDADALEKDTSMEFLPFFIFLYSTQAANLLLPAFYTWTLLRGEELAFPGHSSSTLFSTPAFQGHHALEVPVCPCFTSSHVDIHITGSHAGLNKPSQ